ncbi:PTS system mannose/fructose/sorbose family transporter subunit IID [Lentilactobacillus laojiaonis]|uniref:PTS system mannose/fructose/sorbose family transporter subunit IID n=1 Tax=Lentilactobacillus laojiaonis TaxID=2883998 RepID=UPI001D0B214D|nr:PTS mannose transporter subunit IID [Lentilactobacillus laojiaonis]UDM31887.1 PTS mannose transporter subunit IID [Lentilactobacillus laojiaonis]
MAENVQQNNDNKLKLTRHDMVSIFWRSGFEQASWNYERMQNLGFAYIMSPAIKRLYPEKDDRISAMKRHMEFFNTTPYMQSAITGVVLAMEEQRANGADIDDSAINGVKVGMMGPLAGVGDPIWWGTARPVIGAFSAGLAMSGSGLLGPIIFFLTWNILRLSFRWYTQMLGYKQGTNITQSLGGGLLQKLTEGASILGMFIMGVLVPRWTKMYFPIVISRVHTGGKTTVTTLQDIFDQLLPGLMPLVLTFICIWLLRKKVNAIWIIFGLFIVGILGYWAGIFGIAPK